MRTIIYSTMGIYIIFKAMNLDEIQNDDHNLLNLLQAIYESFCFLYYDQLCIIVLKLICKVSNEK